MGELLWIFVSAALVNNFTLTLFLGLCAFVGVTQKLDTAIRLGAANTFVMLITSAAAWALNTYVLPPAPYLRIIAWGYPFVALSMLAGRILQGLGFGTPVLVLTVMRLLLTVNGHVQVYQCVPVCH